MATDLETAVPELIVDVNIIGDVINENATTEVPTENGPIPSLRKALADNLYFQDPVPWNNGTNETNFNQLRTFTDGTVWWAPSATTINPVPMGVTPVGDSNWYPFQDVNLKNTILEEVTRFNIKGTFANGFTYETVDDVGLDSSGIPWTYTGSLPFIVPAGTVPSSPTYNEESFSSIDALSGVEDVSSLNLTVARRVSTTVAIADNGELGTRYILTDLNDAPAIVVDISDTGGYYLGNLQNGLRKLMLNSEFIKTSYLNMDTAGDNTAALEKILSSTVVVCDTVGVFPSSSVSVTTNNLTIVGGGGLEFIFNGASDTEFFVSIVTDSPVAAIDLGELGFDGNNNAAKIVQVRNEIKGERLKTDIRVFNALQTDSTGLAAGLYVDGGFKLTYSDNFRADNINSTKVSGPISSGARIEQNANSVSDMVIFNNPYVSDITPSDDGDGIVIAQTFPYTGTERTVAIINSGKFHNCDKRAIKTQVYEAHDNNSVVTRDRTTAVSAGKIEIDHQYGNASTNNPTIRYETGDNAPTALFSMNPQRGESDGVGTQISGGSCTIVDDTNEMDYIVFGSSFDSDDKITNSSIAEFKFFGKVNTPLAFRPLASSTFNDVVTDYLTIEMYVKDVTSTSLISLDRSGVGWAFLDNVTVKDTVVANKRVELTRDITTNVGLTSGGYFLVGSENINDPNGESIITFEESGTVDTAQSFTVDLRVNSSLEYTLMYTTNSGTNEMMHRAGTVSVGASSLQILDTTSINRDAVSGGGTLNVSGNIVGSTWTITFSKTAGVATSSGNLSLITQSPNGIFYS